MSEFLKVEIYLPWKLITSLQYEFPTREAKEELLKIVLTELPQEVKPKPIDVKVGLRYAYSSGGKRNTYEVIQVGEKAAVIRRMNDNARGPKGSTLIAQIKKIQHDLSTGEATIVPTTSSGFIIPASTLGKLYDYHG